MNKDWGERTSVPNFECCPNYHSKSWSRSTLTFDPTFTNSEYIEVIDDGGTSSRWQMQIGARYIF
jgi:hypothetical protein